MTIDEIISDLTPVEIEYIGGVYRCGDLPRLSGITDRAYTELAFVSDALDIRKRPFVLSFLRGLVLGSHEVNDQHILLGADDLFGSTPHPTVEEEEGKMN